jgi:hypothetical protein
MEDIAIAALHRYFSFMKIGAVRANRSSQNGTPIAAEFVQEC